MVWLRACAQALAITLLLAGCGVSMPTDPNGTLDRVTGGELRVGISPNGQITQVDDGRYSGSEVKLVKDFAEHINATIEWTVGSEEALVRGLEHDALDLVIAGITDKSPWADRAALTRPYADAPDAWGTNHKLVMLVPMGENAFLSELEDFLDRQGARQ